ncbi:HAD family hydrolase [Metabacillus iocasae]|uniref:Hydroxymethylpyrimidine pyrophosphatase-like HAD family hydrolase n=1 Tax=Priestia iocasae TaxID=2291674 RepID=A0ABS2QU16_9BACI|nr:HAD hydrolase family protein [Metabacillus iocasae]MBM7702487.1 hydroxymethylpyrimidine pyrophosphatase-like HAD family hydrolase [Metabacillus iocasae]
MRAFASDLDRTLIYSRRLITEEIDEASIELVETLNGREVSYMTKKAITQLTNLLNDTMFIPVTTRTTEQYKRISIFSERFNPEYAITTNGAVILKDGEPLSEWTNIIKERMRNLSLSFHETYEWLQTYEKYEWVKSVNEADQTFLYLVVHRESFTDEHLQTLRDYFQPGGWRVYAHGRKIYCIPTAISKWSAVSFLKEKLGIDRICAAGDSELDVEMILHADFGIAPIHGELAKMDYDVTFTTTMNIEAAEEMLQRVEHALSTEVQL